MANLIIATKAGNLAQVNQLIAEEGIDLDAVDGTGDTALSWASYYGYVQIVQALLAAGANPDTESNQAWIPLHCAISSLSLATLRALLDGGADINSMISTPGKETALQWAIASGSSTEMVQLLLDRGATVRVEDMQCAAANPSFPFLEAAWHSQGGAVSVSKAAVATAAAAALIAAAKGGDLPALCRCLKDGGDPNATDTAGETALSWAAYMQQPGAVALLLSAGAAVNTVCRSGYSALRSALTSGDAACAEALLRAGADPNAAFADGTATAPLSLALRSGDLQMLRLLRAHGAVLPPAQAAAAREMLQALVMEAGGGGTGGSGTGGSGAAPGTAAPAAAAPAAAAPAAAPAAAASEGGPVSSSAAAVLVERLRLRLRAVEEENRRLRRAAAGASAAVVGSDAASESKAGGGSGNAPDPMAASSSCPAATAAATAAAAAAAVSSLLQVLAAADSTLSLCAALNAVTAAATAATASVAGVKHCGDGTDTSTAAKAQLIAVCVERKRELPPAVWSSDVADAMRLALGAVAGL